MIKITILFIASLLLFGLGVQASAFTAKGEEMIKIPAIGDAPKEIASIASREISLKEIEKIIQQEQAKLAPTIKRQNKELLNKKDTKVAKAINGQNETLNTFIGKDGILDKMSKSLSSVGSDIGWVFWIVCSILLLSIFLLIGVGRTYKKVKIIHDQVMRARNPNP